MSDEKNMELSQQVYRTLCYALNNRGWRFDKDDAELQVFFGVNGEKMPMQFIIAVDNDRQLIRLLSPMPYQMREEKKVEGAVAACTASFKMADGSFDYDLADGQIVFRLTASYRESFIGEGLFQYMISCACAVVDTYNTQFKAIDEGDLSIADFLKREN